MHGASLKKQIEKAPAAYNKVKLHHHLNIILEVKYFRKVESKTYKLTSQTEII